MYPRWARACPLRSRCHLKLVWRPCQRLLSWSSLVLLPGLGATLTTFHPGSQCTFIQPLLSSAPLSLHKGTCWKWFHSCSSLLVISTHTYTRKDAHTQRADVSTKSSYIFRLFLCLLLLICSKVSGPVRLLPAPLRSDCSVSPLPVSA